MMLQIIQLHVYMAKHKYYSRTDWYSENVSARYEARKIMSDRYFMFTPFSSTNINFFLSASSDSCETRPKTPTKARL